MGAAYGPTPRQAEKLRQMAKENRKERKDSTSSTTSSYKRDRSRAGEDTPSKKRDDKRSPGPKPKK